MATREQLAKIFALESEAVRDEIEKLDRAAKRGGTLRDTAYREADRQVGMPITCSKPTVRRTRLTFKPGQRSVTL
jgi:hypothetical protein